MNNNNIQPGTKLICLLSNKELIVQLVFYSTGENPQYSNHQRKIVKLACRYHSQKHDEFKYCTVYPGEYKIKNQIKPYKFQV